MLTGPCEDHHIISLIKVGIKGSIIVLHNLGVPFSVYAFKGNDLVSYVI